MEKTPASKQDAVITQKYKKKEQKQKKLAKLKT